LNLLGIPSQEAFALTDPGNQKKTKPAEILLDQIIARLRKSIL